MRRAVTREGQAAGGREVADTAVASLLHRLLHQIEHLPVNICYPVDEGNEHIPASVEGAVELAEALHHVRLLLRHNREALRKLQRGRGRQSSARNSRHCREQYNQCGLSELLTMLTGGRSRPPPKRVVNLRVFCSECGDKAIGEMPARGSAVVAARERTIAALIFAI